MLILSLLSVEQLRNIEFLKAFGLNLKKLRLQKGFTQEKLAFSIGVEISQISRIERGILNTSISTAEAIARALNIPISDLFEFNNQKTTNFPQK